ncbi:Iron-regulated ABC transporter permease protein SufD [Abditibacterium utsteinense]|uniref:Iron-regulated ABC transporter permease protein SufD n=1 Tax=Abditibacterium utsteinense TaxID=1960156 RepID=A0A2S8SWS6_9BACT|nr:Fe-S cluster assembly protein SufD [Abditibacterium utsteinense]PQV65224.1 Iron-regulated ABC transporter permease protein SufD [Abditibacterium utsteinense]
MALLPDATPRPDVTQNAATQAAHSPAQTSVARYVELFSQFEREHPASNWLANLRRQSLQNFQKLGFPTVRDEEWKYTDITPAANLVATPVFKADLNGSAQKISQELPFGDILGHRLTFVNGHFSPELSRLETLGVGVTVTSLAAAFANENEIVQEHFGKILDAQNETFAALNTAFAQDGAFIQIGSNVQLETPIHLLFLTHGEGASVSHPRNLILVGDGASATIIETFASTGEGTYFTNAITEIVAGRNARVEHIKVQSESEKAFHVGSLQIATARDANVRSHVVNFGGRLVRNNSTAVMGDEGCEVTLNGLVVGKDSQHIDNHTTMDHAMPHCLSHENYAHVLDDQSNGVFNGKIFVRLDAQKTDAKQSNRTLLLSRDAQINAKPQLEIFADDVKCTHGATIGQLDDDALFYLRARGIPEKQARAILIRAFANAALDGIPVKDLREKLEAILVTRLT